MMRFVRRSLCLNLLALLLCLPLTGCFRTTLILNDGSGEHWARSQTNRMHVMGLVDLDGAVHMGLCEAGVARVEQVMGGFSILVAYASGGLVTMRQAKVYCLEEGAQKAGWLGEDGRLYSEEAVQSMEVISGHTNAS
ncbi:MAG: hypothetical protein VX938_10520 [Myxococcota bacterium]|nr:hypothetical protein [Myxococcota bacterium]